MIDLYYWPTPNGWKISIMLEECGLAYRMIPVNIGEGEQFDPDFLKISPNNRMPAIVDHDGPGGAPYHLMETGAILIYLAEKTGMFLPKDPAGRYRVIEWLMWQMGGVGPMFGQNGHFKLYATEDIPYAKKRYLDESNRLYGVLDRRMAGRDYVADEYSIADMALMPWFMLHRMQGIVMDDYPNVRRWYDLVKQRPAVRRGVDLGRELRRKPEDMGEEQKKNLFGDKQFQKR
ncbi:glutathione S-transferase N-terminal domain-containing protein [Minwuia sp.]|uniref:glutathione S-transferase N-terminal domain-containing protein n=1 Tax=Minwuia sp. TaxID=2493630 RepID=UPI003A926C64